MNLKTALDSYLTDLEHQRRVSPHTVKNYRSTLTRFIAKARKFDEDSVKKFLRSYDNPASRNVALVRLRGFAASLDISLDKVPRAKEEVKEVEALTGKEVDRLLTSARQIDEHLAAAAAFLVNTGLRFHEFQAVRLGKVIERDGYRLLQVKGKGKKHRDVPLNAEAWAALQTLEHFYTRPIDERTFREQLAEAGRAAGLPYHVHPHMLRASRASILLNEKRVDSLKVAKVLGWAKTDTLLKHYYRPTVEALAEACV